MAERAAVAKVSGIKSVNPPPAAQKTIPSQHASSSVDQILFLQRTLGNRAVQRLFKSGVIQARLKIGEPNDIYEQEAGRVADMVMRMPEPNVKKSGADIFAIKEKIPYGTLAGDWKIKSRSGTNPLLSGGKTDEQLLEEAFKEICPLTSRRGDRIIVPVNTASTTNPEGCRCLKDIERGLPALKKSRPPSEIEVEPHGWSQTDSNSDPVSVSVRHPDDPFQWGYWTTTTSQYPNERRHNKPFWQTVAHEVCGHVATFVRTGGTHAGGRVGNPRHHDPAIEAENVVAAEHGVPLHEQRGYEFAYGGRPATRHAGESFLSSAVPDFVHGSAGLPSNSQTTQVIDSVYDTSQNFPVFVELEGRAYANEGGQRLALSRAETVKNALIARGVASTFVSRSGVQSQPFTTRAVVEPGSSIPNACQTGKAVYVYLYHDPRSLGP